MPDIPMPRPTKPARKTRASKPARRDPAKTRAGILAAATAEFAAKGYSGARTEQIARRAKSNIRMLYHYFGGKDALYISVLEEELARLRHDELQLDFGDVEPLQGVVQLFDFIDDHFAAHPELRCLLAFENLNRARHLKQSARIRTMASPVIELLSGLLRRGEQAGVFRAGIDALHLYVSMVSLAYYSKSHAYTLSRIFDTDLASDGWQREQREQTHQMLASFLAAPASSTVSARSRSAA